MKKRRKQASMKTRARREMNYWHSLGIFMLFLILISFFLLAKDSNPLKIHVLIHFFLFLLLQAIAGFKGLYEKKIANGFFQSFKAIDIYTHIYGLFAFYLMFLALFGLNPVFNIFLVFVVSVLFEGFEYLVENIGHVVDRRRDLYQKTYTKYISEPKKNILQDLITNFMGILLGFLYYSLLF